MNNTIRVLSVAGVLAGLTGAQSGPEQLPMLGGPQINPPAFGISFTNNMLTMGELLDVGAVLFDLQPLDLIYLTQKFPSDGATIDLVADIEAFSASIPIGVDQASGMSKYVLGIGLGVNTLTHAHFSEGTARFGGLVAQPGELLELSNTDVTVLPYERVTLQLATPVMSGLLKAGVEASYLFTQTLIHGKFTDDSNLTYTPEGWSGETGVEYVRAGDFGAVTGDGVQFGIGVATAFPGFGFGLHLRGLGSITYDDAIVSRLYAAGDFRTAQELVEALEASETTTTENFTIDLPTELEFYGNFPYYFEGMSEPINFKASVGGSWGGLLAQGWNVGIGADYRVSPELPLGLDFNFGGPAGFGVGLSVAIDLPDADLNLRVSQNGGLLTEAQGLSFAMSSEFQLP